MNSERPSILVTGGSRGIGAAVARLAARRGCDVAIVYKSDSAAAERTASACREAGASAYAYQGDMAKEADVVQVFDRSLGDLGRLTGVVNNAGITGRSSRLDAASADTIRTCIDLNVTGAIFVAREASRRMATRHGGKGGAIVNISSVAASLGSPHEYVWYAAAKGAIDSLTIGLSKELAEDSIRVNAVSPGMVDTEIHALSTGDAARIDRFRPLIPMQRIGSADEIAEAVLFLLSDQASYITGANLRVSGGR
jgi:NAD(P)-dependent dehydrogenase (short-subunit alcohol dehydrogenase family)